MYDTQFRALAASNVLMWLAIGFGALPWWLSSVEMLDWIVAAGMSAVLISVSLILSGCVTRFGEATEHQHYLTAGLTIGLGLVLVGIEAAMTHQGLAWIDARTVRNDPLPASEGKRFPRIPEWRINGNLRYAITDTVKASVPP
jgi:hypothetical protein